MLYLLDANTLIHAKNEYYPLERVPEFWDWLVHQGELGNIKVPLEIYDEFSETRGSNGEQDALSEWSSQSHVRSALLLEEDVIPDHLSRVVYGGYLPNPTDSDLSSMGRDPFLISYALRDIENRCIVTGEVSKPSKQGSNKKVPDVCDILNVHWIGKHQIIRSLNFTTYWHL